jgi:hypothetical protein
MKRCPQCEFIYEDDQNLCDMDGVMLVFESRTLPNLHALATVPEMPGKSTRRTRMVPAFATIIVTVAVASFYYFSNQRTIAPANNFPPASVPGAAAAAPEAPVVVPPAPSPELNQAQPPVSEPVEPAEAEKQPASPAKPAAAAPAPAPGKKATTKPATVKSPEPKKDGSKVGSILRKTGKILKKPFKF